MKNILVLLWSDWKSMRNFLYGFAMHARTRRDWIVHLRSSEDLSLPATAEKVKSGFYSAIVANEETLKAHPEIAENRKQPLSRYLCGQTSPTSSGLQFTGHPSGGFSPNVSRTASSIPKPCWRFG